MATAPARNQPPARQDPVKTVQDLLLRSQSQIQMALPKHLNAERLTRVALTTIRQTPNLLNCDPLSLVKCVMQAAALGLEPDPLLGRAYLVPYGRECQLIIGYKGLIDLARRSGEIQSVEAHCVYENDQWEYSYGLKPVLFHKPTTSDNRGNMVAAWALAIFKGGGHQFEVMSKADIDRIRKGSKAGNSGPWVSHYDEMARKTVLRRLAKLLPLSPALASHLVREEQMDAGVVMPPETYGDDETPMLEAPSSESEKLLSRMGEKPAEPAEENEPGSQG